MRLPRLAPAAAVLALPVAAAAVLRPSEPTAAPAAPAALARPAARLPEVGGGSALALRLKAQAEAALVAHDFVAAVRSTEALLAEAPHDRWALLHQSDALLELGRLDEAEAALQRVLDLKPTASAYFRAAYLLHLRGEEEAAPEVMRLALDAVPRERAAERAWILAELGDLLRSAGRRDAAEEVYRQALRLSPRSDQAQRGLARLALSRGDAWEAMRLLGDAAHLPEDLGLLARLEAEAGQAARAQATLRRALEAGEADDHLHRSLALCLADHGLETERAVALARREVELRPNAHSWDALAWALHADGRPSEALEAAERALACGVQEPQLLYHAGAIARAAGRPELARRWLEAAAARDPRYAPAITHSEEESA